VQQVLLGDTPCAISMAANSGYLNFLAPHLAFVNSFNGATGILGTVADLLEIKNAWQNPLATKTDRWVDVAHFLVGDVVETGAGVIPLFTSLANPWAYGFFMGGQAIGIAADVSKLCYDLKHQGQQGAHPNPPPVQDWIERVADATAPGLELLGLRAGLSVPMGGPLSAMCQMLTWFGGGMSIVGGMTLMQKSRLLARRCDDSEAAGSNTVAVPVLRRRASQERVVPNDVVRKVARRNQWLGAAQIAAGTTVLAAGCMTCAPLTFAAMGAALASAVASAGVKIINERSVRAAAII
jgi:hypothetical protein